MCFSRCPLSVSRPIHDKLRTSYFSPPESHFREFLFLLLPSGKGEDPVGEHTTWGGAEEAAAGGHGGGQPAVG